MSMTIQRSMASGAMWMVLFKLTERSLGAISTLILVRLLAPGDFGIVSMAVSFVAMAELLAAFGFDVALIQVQAPSAEHYHTAWTLNALLGLAITLLMLASAAPIAAFYQRPEVRWVVLALAFGPLISGFENIGVVAFRKELQFRREFAYQFGRKLAGFLVAVPLAFWLRSYWALVGGTLAAKLIGTLLSYYAHGFRPRPCLVQAGSLLHQSKWLLAGNFLVFLKTRTSDFLLGRLRGPEALGLYNVSAELASLPTTELGAPINRALLPGFARIGSDPPALLAAYRNAVGFVALFVVPAAAGIYATAGLIVPVVLGPRWSGAAPLIQVLAVNGAMTVVDGAIYTIMLAIGHPRDVTRINFIHVAFYIALMAVLIGPVGILGAAYAVLCASIGVAPFFLYFLHKHTGISPLVFLASIARPLAAAAAMLVLLHAVLPAEPAALPLGTAVAWLAAAVGIGVAAYVLALVAIWLALGRPEGVERVALERVREALRRRARA